SEAHPEIGRINPECASLTRLRMAHAVDTSKTGQRIAEVLAAGAGSDPQRDMDVPRPASDRMSD
ncbi:MAG TPA: hypothetical protein VIT90_08685, partial [Lysobacter sp.]